MSQIFNYKFIAFFLNKKKSKHLYMAVRTLYAKLKGLLRKRKKKKREFVFGKKNNFYFLLKRFT